MLIFAIRRAEAGALSLNAYLFLPERHTSFLAENIWYSRKSNATPNLWSTYLYLQRCTDTWRTVLSDKRLDLRKAILLQWKTVRGHAIDFSSLSRTSNTMDSAVLKSHCQGNSPWLFASTEAFTVRSALPLVANTVFQVSKQSHIWMRKTSPPSSSTVSPGTKCWCGLFRLWLRKVEGLLLLWWLSHGKVEEHLLSSSMSLRHEARTPDVTATHATQHLLHTQSP